jgi:SAM-dependent methyltransferase
MDSYTAFAKVYDLCMQDVPYTQWVDNLQTLWNKHNIKPSEILDLGCGTGTITEMLAKKGYNLIGVDNSIDMLIQATANAKQSNANILYLNQNMCKFKLHEKVDCIISICDCVNYILEEEALLSLFNTSKNYLNPNGLFIFDVNTKYKYQNILADNSFSETFDDCAYIWENFFDEETSINEYFTCFFTRTKSNLYERHEELHYQRAYSIEEIKNIIDKSELQLVEILDTETLTQPTQKSERIYFVLK